MDLCPEKGEGSTFSRQEICQGCFQGYKEVSCKARLLPGNPELLGPNMVAWASAGAGAQGNPAQSGWVAVLCLTSSYRRTVPYPGHSVPPWL